MWLSLTPTPTLRRTEPGVASRAEGRCPPTGILCIPCLSPGAQGENGACGEKGARGEKGEPLPSPGAPGRLCRGLGVVPEAWVTGGAPGPRRTSGRGAQTMPLAPPIQPMGGGRGAVLVVGGWRGQRLPVLPRGDWQH